MLKERSSRPPNFEADNIRFLRENTTLPVPEIVEEWNEDNGRYFIITKRIRGNPLSEIWWAMPTAERELVAK